MKLPVAAFGTLGKYASQIQVASAYNAAWSAVFLKAALDNAFCRKSKAYQKFVENASEATERYFCTRTRHISISWVCDGRARDFSYIGASCSWVG